PPEGVEVLDDSHQLASTTWTQLADDPTPLLATGIADEAWCDRAVARLAAASQRVDIAGDHLVHGDLWRQNWCTAADRGAVLVDWTGAARGNPLVNAAWGECGVRACGGPGGIVFPAGHREHGPWSAWMSGLAVGFLLHRYAERARTPRLHETQLREAIAGLAWASETLGIDAPTPAADVLPAGPWRP
ncbi:MAG: phosphotransferase, partial [Thermoleophilia bacterium]|nr:phosphotransferase [Thermoleophilia bacterium]